MRVPGEFGHPSTCLMQAQAFLAGTSIGKEFGDNDRVKVICARTETVNDSNRQLSIE
jgi:hypothetical protein